MTNLPDELNPELAFQTLNSDLLAKFATGELDPVEYIKRELASRGLNEQGEWVGFKK